MGKNIKEEVMNYITKTYEKINSNEKLQCKEIKIEDLKLWENYLKECKFIKVNKCSNNDIICIYPESKLEKDNMKILYTEELENKDSKYIVFKLFSELFIFINGYYNYKYMLDIINHCYLFLYHLYILPDVKIRYGISTRKNIYDNLKTKHSEFISQYTLNITEEKLNYYLSLALDENLKASIFIKNKYEFSDGKIVKFNYFKTYITQGDGIRYFGCFKDFHEQWEKEYDYNYDYPGINTFIFDNNNKILKDKDISKEIRYQYRIITKLS